MSKLEPTSVPQNVTAEKSALSMLASNQRLIAEMPWTEDLFFNPAHQIIFRALEEAAQAGDPGDFIAITSKLEAEGTLEAVGGVGGVTEILTSMVGTHPDTANYYRRQLIAAKKYRTTLRAISDALPDLGNMVLPLPEFSERIAAACITDEEQKSETLAQQMEGLFAELERREPQEAFTTGLESLDHLLAGGIHRKQLAVVAAETGGGKSILLAMAALNNAQAGKSVVIFSLEMPAQEILKRMAANLAGVQVKTMNQKPTTPEMDCVRRALIRLSELPLTIIDTMTSLGEIEAEARRLARLGKADLMIVDYIQLVANDGADSREQAISEIARRFKNLSVSSDTAVMTASQLNEDGKLRESRAIGHHSDHILVIGDGKISVVKNRGGQACVSTTVTMRGELGRFEDRER